MQQYRREWRMAKATESSQLASKRIHNRNHKLGSQISNMEDSLQSIQQKQMDFSDSMLAQEEVENALTDTVPGSGSPIKPLPESTESVLARIKAKKDKREN